MTNGSRALGYLVVLRLSFVVLAGLFMLAALQVPAAQFIHGDAAGASTFVDGFWLPDTRESMTFRWTNGNSHVALPNWEKVQSLAVSLKLSGPQWSGSQPVDLAIETSDHAPMAFQVVGSWRWHHILIPHTASGWQTPEFYLRSNTQVPGTHDQRMLGVAVAGMDIRPTTQLSMVSVAVQALYYAALMILIFVFLWNIAVPWPMLMVVSMLWVGFALYAIADPLAAAGMVPVDWHWVAIVGAVAGASQIARACSAAPYAGVAWIMVGLISILAGHLLALTFPGVLAGCGLILIGALIITQSRYWHEHQQTTNQHIRTMPSIKSLLITIGIGIVIAPIFLSNLETRARYHSDESFWVASGVTAFQKAFIQHDPQSSFWQDPYGTFGSFNPQVGKYVIGASVYLAGYPDLTARPYNFSYSLEWNDTHGNLLPTPIIAAGRLPVALAGIVSCMLLFWLVLQSTNLRYALLVIILVLTGRPLVELSQLALIDAPACAFSLLSINLLFWNLKAIRWQDRYAVWLTVLVGICCGLAIGTKMNAIPIYFIIIAIFALEPLPWKLRLRSIVLVTLWTWVVVFISNPFLYTQPIDGVRHILSLSSIVGMIDTGQRLPMLADRIGAIWNFLALYSPLYQVGLPGDYFLLLCGGIALVYNIRRAESIDERQYLRILLIWLVVGYAVVTLWIPQDWNRYYLPLQPINVLLEAYGIIWLLRSVTMVGWWCR